MTPRRVPRSRRRVPRSRHLPRRLAALTGIVLLSLSLMPISTATAEQDDGPAFTMLGRGYGLVLGYPADEVPSTGGDEEQPERPPDQTCPKGQRGVPEDIQRRIDALISKADAKPLDPRDSDVPTPRGQPIKFDIGLADTSLRSDPGSHAIASFFYVDLGGGQDPGTSSEADGYASGHTREQERCGQPYSSEPGDADDVHVISRATTGPYAYAFNQTQNLRLPAGASARESITVSEMDARGDVVTGTVVSVVAGVTVGTVHADEVVSVIRYRTDGEESGTTVTAHTDVAGLTVAGEPQRVRPGAEPVDVGGVLVGVAAPEARELSDGSLDVTVGGLYVGGQFDNPVGAQAKQAVFVGGAWYQATSAQPLPPPQPLPLPADNAQAPIAPQQPVSPEMPTGFTGQQPADGAPATPPEVAPQAAETPRVAPATTRHGVYTPPAQVVGPVLLLAGLLMAFGTTVYIWARHRYPEIRAALGTPLFAWLDYGYRAFLRG
ncbi:MAG: hypothetical protein GEU97_19250 [Actinophytocola sp.]|nr:hypothetical protein [Actinophytocola sp.]